MAHQWFGDLVTTAWWDDIWLNEAFATWMESKITAEWKPEWRMDVSDVEDRLGAMETDSLATTRKIRQPIARTTISPTPSHVRPRRPLEHRGAVPACSAT